MRKTLMRSAALALATLGSTIGLAQAQTASSQTSPARTLGQSSVFTLQGENSSISSSKLTDRYYTNGIRIGYLSGEGDFGVLRHITQPLWGEGAPRLAIDLTQQIYTPSNTTTRNPPLSDRPYAGVLLANIAAVQDGVNTRSSIGLSLGLIGPSALGEEVQNGFHDLIGQGHNNGWNTQLHNEAVFALNSARVWRINTGTLAGLQTDVLPALAGTLGTLAVDVETGISVRLGQGLENDYGAPRIRALSGGDAFRRGDRIGWYVFAGVHGKAVARDVTLDGNTFQNSRSVKLTPLVGEASGGAAILAYGMRLSYTHVVQTQDFKHQKGGPHQFGSLALSIRF